MDFLEKDLEDIICENIIDNYNELYVRGFNIPQPYLVKRQFKIGNYGIADVVLLHRVPEGDEHYLYISVIELKKKTIDYKSLLQVYRYGRGIEKWLGYNNKYTYYIKHIIIGKHVEVNDDFVFLLSHLNNLKIFTYKYDIEGMYFKENMGDYIKLNEGFNGED